MKTHTLGAGQFIEFIEPVKGMKHINIMWTADIQMKWRCDHRSFCNHNCDDHIFTSFDNTLRNPIQNRRVNEIAKPFTTRLVRKCGNLRNSRIIASAFKVSLKMSQEIVNFHSLSDNLKQANFGAWVSGRIIEVFPKIHMIMQAARLERIRVSKTQLCQVCEGRMADHKLRWHGSANQG